MENAAHPRRSRVIHQCRGIRFGVTRVDDHWAAHARCELDLRGKRGTLKLARGIVVVVVEAALPDGDGTGINALFDERDVARRVKRCRVVRVNPGRGEYESGIGFSYSHRCGSRRERLADADDPLRARRAGACDYRFAVAVEGRVREVGVAVDEDDLPSVLRGHFRSIHRRIGAAT